jgi:hypothetical protein
LYISFAVRTIETMRTCTDNAAVTTTLENLFALCGGQDEFLNGEVARALAMQVKEAFGIWKAEIEAGQQQQLHVRQEEKRLLCPNPWTFETLVYLNLGYIPWVTTLGFGD